MTSRTAVPILLSIPVLLTVTAGYLAALTFAEQNEILLQQLESEHRLTPSQMEQIRAIFARAQFLGQGNPDAAEHPMTPDECRTRVEAAGGSS